MPNWANNVLEITGPNSEIKRFIDFVHTEFEAKDYDGNPKKSFTNFDLNKICKMPEELVIDAYSLLPEDNLENLQLKLEDPNVSDFQKEICKNKILQIHNQEKFGFASWYEWRNHNWGIKWNVFTQEDWVLNDGVATISYDSPWTCPDRAIQKASELFPELSFVNYAIEHGMNWACKITCYQGFIEEESGTIQDMPHISWDIFGFEEEEEEEEEEEVD